jgi:hypothetical protein
VPIRTPEGSDEIPRWTSKALVFNWGPHRLFLSMFALAPIQCSKSFHVHQNSVRVATSSQGVKLDVSSSNTKTEPPIGAFEGDCQTSTGPGRLNHPSILVVHYQKTGDQHQTRHDCAKSSKRHWCQPSEIWPRMRPACECVAQIVGFVQQETEGAAHRSDEPPEPDLD